MPRNFAETPESQKPTTIVISAASGRAKLDRRLSVAPMMDWTDDAEYARKINRFWNDGVSCLLYVSSAAAAVSNATAFRLRRASAPISLGSAMSIPAIDRMSSEEKLQALEALWESIAREGDRYPPPAWHEDELKRTQERFESRAEQPMDWETAKQQLRR